MVPTHTLTDPMTEPVRLAKYLTTSLPCSRREAELYITNGWVRVDGVVVEEPQFMVTEQSVQLDPNAELSPALPASMLMHKPAGVDAESATALQALVNPATRSHLDNTGVRLLKRHFVHQSSVLPLESEASGLIVLMQDRHLARRLYDDRARFEQEYLVEVVGSLDAQGLVRMNNGDGIRGPAPLTIKVSWQSETRLRVAAKALRPGNIKQMCETVGLQLISLRRLRIGRIPMAKLAPGEWRYLADYERL